MAEGKPSWFDWLNFAATVFVGAAGLVLAVVLARSADHGARVSTMVATTTFLVDADPRKQDIGIKIARALTGESGEHVAWFDQLVSDITAGAPGAPPSERFAAVAPVVTPPPAPAPTPAPPVTPEAVQPAIVQPAPPAALQPAGATGEQVGARLYDALAGSNPRLYMQIASASQRDGADALRRDLAAARLSGQAVVAPAVELVARPASRFELRYLKADDAQEAGRLAALIAGELGTAPQVIGLPRFFEDVRVKPRTYELWFPPGMEIKPSGSSGGSW